MTELVNSLMKLLADLDPEEITPEMIAQLREMRG